MADGSEAGPRFTILGPLAVRAGCAPIDPGPYKQRVVLGMLLLRPNRIVPVDRLLEAVWPAGQPKTARKNLQVYVSALRKVVGDGIRYASYGYALDVDPDQLDALRFDELATAGYAAYHAGDLRESRVLLGRAVDLWRGEALADLADNPAIATAAEQLGQRRLAVYEDWVDLEIDAGRHLAILGRLTRQARRHPFRERLTAATITALHRAGRRREALSTFEAHRQLVARELGVTPSPVLQRLYRSLLADGATRTPSARPTGAGGHLRPAQLPRDVPDFVGRAGPLDALVTTLTAAAGNDVAVVTGAVGTGKTALAVRAGRRMSGTFGDGEIFVSLRGPDGRPRALRDLATELLRAAGLEVPLPHDAHEVSAVWRSWIADREFLVILDDAVDAAQVQHLLPGSGRNRTLVTSSHRLSALESVHRTRLDEMTDDEAGELLERTLGPGADAGPFRRVLDRTGRAPLVVRAVLTRLDALRYGSMDEYADLLDSAPSVLGALPFGGGPVRERVARVYADLPEPQQRAVRVLGRLPDAGATWPELVERCAVVRQPAADVVDRLVEANILGMPDQEVVAPSARYRMPALIRHFAAELDGRFSAPSPPASRAAMR